ncbi:MAG: hypothetical protein JJ975_02780 [Bacteroidia bacterium]|nr:hypothetical protein [Bacteroidia bacterium]
MIEINFEIDDLDNKPNSEFVKKAKEYLENAINPFRNEIKKEGGSVKITINGRLERDPTYTGLSEDLINRLEAVIKVTMYDHGNGFR